MDNVEIRYSVKLSFEEVILPPFKDVLILGKDAPQGKIAVFKSLELLMPGEFEMIETKDEKAAAVYVHKKLLVKLSKDQIMTILRNKVFPYLVEGEILKVDFRISGSVIL